MNNEVTEKVDEALIRVLPRYAERQRTLMPAVDGLLAIGVVDMRHAMIAGNVVRAITWHRAIAVGGHEHAGAWATGPAARVNQLLTAAPWSCP
ncbi:hypothetical protein [Dactylosporangium sp. CA-139066]|uniref:hypothetical protein n=1 Tax=Dactylosporangium sp. CA-139066 TaxID=3239930 RepID=UPI003D8BC541